MKTILVSINAKFIHTNNAVRLLKVNSDFKVDILEYTIKDSIDNIISDLLEASPDVIGFSTYIWNIEYILALLTKLSVNGLRTTLNRSKIILGGPEVSYESAHLLTKYPIDYILKGEAEISFNNLLYAINKNTDVSKISGITYKNKHTIINNPIVEIPDLSIIKQPYYLKEDLIHIPNKISYIESSRGCPYNCSYCLSSLEKTVRFFNISEVEKAILYLMKNGSKTIKFLDRTFNANKDTFNLLKFIIENHNGYTVFQFEITGDILKKEIIEYLNQHAKKGIFRFEIGIQSINYETNYLVDRIQNNEVLFENIKLIRAANVIDMHLDLIAGLPKENLELFKDTFNAVYHLGAKELQLGFLKLLKGTKIRSESEKYHYQFQENAPYEFTSNDSLSTSDKEEILLVEKMLAIYHNKGYFGTYLEKLILHYFSPFDFFRDIGKYYIENNIPFKGYQVHEVYQYLFNFLDNEYTEFLLIIDYLRRAKIKPKLFWDQKVSKEIRRLVFEDLINSYSALNLNILYKHSVLIEGSEMYYIIIYQDNHKSDYFIKKSNIIKAP